jgi:endonuclease-3
MSIAPAKLPLKVLADRKARIAKILPILKETYPHAKCSLNFSTPLQLLVATILSAQCTDDRVNIVTKDLFRKYKSAADYASAAPGALEKDIQSTGFYRNKAKNIRAMAQSILDKHHDQVPKTMEELTSLAGVGRKTANVVLGNAFDISVGIVVDTHVTRVSNRVALTDHVSDAVKIEQDLMAVVPPKDWTLWSHLLIHHGRAICQARRPKCEECPLLPYCPAGQQFIRDQKDAAN